MTDIDGNLPYQSYEKLRSTGVNYIKDQEMFLLLSLVYPLFLFCVQLLNLGFITGLLDFLVPVQPPPPPNGPNTPPPPQPIDTLIPTVVLLIFAVFAIFHFVFLLNWRQKMLMFEGQKRGIDRDEPGQTTVHLTELFYGIVEHMERTRVIFVLLNIAAIIYSYWLFGFFVQELRMLVIPAAPPVNVFMKFLNFLCQVGLIFYLFIQWKHFLRWNRKLQKIKDFEQKIYDEILS